jgi:transcriptional regulator GlxA family with amidase domain
MSRKERKLIAFPLYAGVTPLDLVGPLTVLRNLYGTPYRTVVVGERVAEVASDTALRLVPVATFTDVPEPYAVIVPGGGAATLEAMNDQALIGYVRSAAANAELVGATGNGALILAAAGLLKGQRAAVHWVYGELLETYGATWVRDRWVEDGPFITAAGGSAGIDMTLALLARWKSRSGAQLAQLFMEYDPEPPFGRVDPADADADLAGVLRTPRSPASPSHRAGD